MCGKAEDAGGLAPAKDDNEAARHFIRRTLPIFSCADYKENRQSFGLPVVLYLRPRRFRRIRKA